MQTRIRKWGNSAGTIIPAAILKKAGFELDAKLEIEVVEGGILLRPATASYTLDDLLKVSPAEALATDDEDRQWLNASAVGKEVL